MVHKLGFLKSVILFTQLLLILLKVISGDRVHRVDCQNNHLHSYK